MLLLQLTGGKFSFTTDVNLRVFNTFYFLDDDNELKDRPNPRVGGAYAFLEMLIGTASIQPISQTIFTQYFTMDPPLKTVAPDNSVTEHITQAQIESLASGKGMSLSSALKYILPGVVKLPLANGTSSVSHCASIILGLSIENPAATFTIKMNLQTATFSSLTNDYILQYGSSTFTLPGLIVSHMFSAQPTKLNIWLTVCQTSTDAYSRVAIALANAARSHYSEGVKRSTTAGLNSTPLDLHISTTGPAGTFKIYLMQVKVFQGGMDSLTLSALPLANCVFQSYYQDSALVLLPYCLQCADTFLFDPVTKTCKALASDDCNEANIMGRCTMCTNIYNYLTECCDSECPPAWSAGLQSYGGESLNYYQQTTPPTVRCSTYQSYSSSTSCSCLVQDCQDCSLTMCSQCMSGFSLTVVNGTVECTATQNIVGMGVDASDPANPVFMTCAVEFCQDCAADYTRCFKCVDSQDCQLSCDPGCSSCAANATDPEECLTCKPGFSRVDGNYCFDCVKTPGFTVVNGECMACEDAGFYIDNSTTPEICKACHASCATCSGPMATECTNCTAIRRLNYDGTCPLKDEVKIVKAQFASDLRQVLVTFNKPVKSASASIMSISEMMVYNNPKDQVITAVSANSQPLSSITSLTPTVGVNILSAVVKDTVLVVKIDASSSIYDCSFAIKFKQERALVDPSNADSFYDSTYIVVDRVSLLVTDMDKGLDNAKGAMSSTVNVLTLLLLLISVPQAFVLMKLFQTIDFYIYIDCDFPSNFSKFLEIFSQGIMDMMPNFFAGLTDDDGLAVYPRFEEFGWNVHVFANLGRHFSLCLILGGLKLIAFGLKFAFRKTKHSKHFSSRMA